MDSLHVFPPRSFSFSLHLFFSLVAPGVVTWPRAPMTTTSGAPRPRFVPIFSPTEPLSLSSLPRGADGIHDGGDTKSRRLWGDPQEEARGFLFKGGAGGGSETWWGPRGELRHPALILPDACQDRWNAGGD